MKIPILLSILLFIFSCGKICTEELLYGEMLEIPINFQGFTSNEIRNIIVIRINENDTSRKDTAYLDSYIQPGYQNSNEVKITDKYPFQYQDSFGYYSSYFDQCHLILIWQNSSDTLKNMRVKKSKGQADECHKNDPNIRIDELSFFHKGIQISKNTPIIIVK